MTTVDMTQIQTPLGLMLACATERGICMLEFTDKEERFQRRLQTELMQVTKAFTAPVKSDNPLFKPLREQLSAYFGKELKQFDLPLELVGTEFQKKYGIYCCKFHMARSFPTLKRLSKWEV